MVQLVRNKNNYEIFILFSRKNHFLGGSSHNDGAVGGSSQTNGREKPPYNAGISSSSEVKYLMTTSALLMFSWILKF